MVGPKCDDVTVGVFAFCNKMAADPGKESL